jgi:transcriptional/translational regulatory protein YebC/TACO1
MGRIFETRKATMFARWDKMSKAFARIGKEITIAVKASGPSPENNPSLRRIIQNARAVNMPKDKVEAAIKRASGQNVAAYEEILYEGYAPHGVAVLVETRPTTRPARWEHPGAVRGGGNLAGASSVPLQAHGRAG